MKQFSSVTYALGQKSRQNQTWCAGTEPKNVITINQIMKIICNTIFPIQFQSVFKPSKTLLTSKNEDF